ncbi:MAG: hypothetical protein WAO58_04350 [Fimbriimonadaceae bacterium]
MGHRRALFLSLAAVAALSPAWAYADWSVVFLHGPTARAPSLPSTINGVGPNMQVGTFGTNQIEHSWRATLWYGSAQSRVNLHPLGALQSSISATDGFQQVGTAVFRDPYRYVAGLWTGTAQSWVVLDPLGDRRNSAAYGVDQGRQVGRVDVDTEGRSWAVVWSGTPASMRNLHPSNTYSSVAYGIQGDFQVGETTIERLGQPHASLWNNTWDTWVDLHPPTEEDSAAYDVYNEEQVGFVNHGQGLYHAALWYGSAGSWVDLSPKGGGKSMARAVWDGYQVGEVEMLSPHVHHASLWRGTAESWFSLQALLPPEYTSSDATDIRIVDGKITVGGSAYNSRFRRSEAVLWIWTP